MLHEVDWAPTLWWRFGDIFQIWTHGKEHLIKFIDEINRLHPPSSLPPSTPLLLAPSWTLEYIKMFLTIVMILKKK